jgi:hypothetical protein
LAERWQHIAEGVTDVEVLGGALRNKDAELKEALAGRLEPVYRLLLKQHMEQVRLLRQQVEEINQALGAPPVDEDSGGGSVRGAGTDFRDRPARRTVCLPSRGGGAG